MADFGIGQIPELTQQRLDATAADCQERGQKAFEAARPFGPKTPKGAE